jgi:tRNA-modifying protein YgfZ
MTSSTAVTVEAGPDRGAAWHFGDPVAEQRALAAGRAAVDLSHRPVLRIAGPDRLAWLHSLTSQHVENLEPRQGTQALVLSPHGHVEHHLALVDDGDAVLAHVEPGRADDLRDYLERMKFWSDVRVEDVSDQWAVVLDTGTSPSIGPAVVRAYGRESFVPRVELTRVLVAYDQPAGMWAAEALRVETKQPRLGFETDHRTIPHEVGWLANAVHLDNGCYRGQETVARVHNLGRPPRRLVLLHLDGMVAAPGCAVTAGGRAVGFVGSSEMHHELGPIALAVVKRSTGAGVPLVVTDPDGAQVAATIDPEAELAAPTRPAGRLHRPGTEG